MALDRPPIAAEIRATLAVAAPLAAANLAQMAMQVTNAVMVGHLGAVPLAAAGLGNALNATLLMTSQGLLTAVAPLAAHSIGAGDHPAAGRVAGGGLIVATAVAAPMMATLMVVPPLLSGVGYEPRLVAEIGRFLWAISWGVPGFLGAAVLRFLLIAAFRTRIVMIVPLLAVPLNLVLNWVLIFGPWGMPALGSAGSGCATAIVQWLTFFSFAHFLLGLQRSGIAFTAADMPNANRLTVGIMAMVAEEERRAISDRTKAALAAAKARGVKLGGRPESLKNTELGRQRGAEARRVRAAARATDLAPVIEAIRAEGVTSATGVAKALNERGIPTARRRKWHGDQVLRVYH